MGGAQGQGPGGVGELGLVDLHVAADHRQDQPLLLLPLRFAAELSHHEQGLGRPAFGDLQ